MALEKEIKQISFQSEYHKLAVNIIYTGNWFNLKLHKFFKQYNLSNQQYNLLRILRGQHPKPATINLLIERMLDKASNASRLVDKLVLKKYVIRMECKQDRRAVDVFITDEGLQLLEKIDTNIKQIYDSLSNLSEHEAKIVNHLLDKLRS